MWTLVGNLVCVLWFCAQVLVDAVKNGGPREDSTRIGSAGVVRRQAVDVSPLRRVNQAIYLICTGAPIADLSIGKIIRLMKQPERRLRVKALASFTS